ncbi:unnamed protein product, partial [Trichogramma brassicae]
MQGSDNYFPRNRLHHCVRRRSRRQERPKLHQPRPAGLLGRRLPPAGSAARRSRLLTCRESHAPSVFAPRCEASTHTSARVSHRQLVKLLFVTKLYLVQKVNEWIGEELTLSKIKRDQMGVYHCIASNGVPPSISKRIIIDVTFPPVIHVPNQLVGAPLGTDVTLECIVEAFPVSINFWRGNKDDIIITSSRHEVQILTKPTLKGHHSVAHPNFNFKVRMLLIIRNFTKQDVGTYKCIAKNSNGEFESSIRLYDLYGACLHTYIFINHNKQYFNKNIVPKDLLVLLVYMSAQQQRQRTLMKVACVSKRAARAQRKARGSLKLIRDELRLRQLLEQLCMEGRVHARNSASLPWKIEDRVHQARLYPVSTILQKNEFRSDLSTLEASTIEIIKKKQKTQNLIKYDPDFSFLNYLRSFLNMSTTPLIRSLRHASCPAKVKAPRRLKFYRETLTCKTSPETFSPIGQSDAEKIC